MTTPGFTAEASLYQASGYYRMVAAFDQARGSIHRAQFLSKDTIMRLPGWTADTAQLSANRRSAAARVWTDDSRTIIMQSCNPVDFIPCSFHMQVCFVTTCWWTRLPFVSRAACTT